MERKWQHWTTNELMYLCSEYEMTENKKELAKELGRTYGAITVMIARMRADGRYEEFKKMGA